jgi:hypothetical protein
VVSLNGLADGDPGASGSSGASGGASAGGGAGGVSDGGGAGGNALDGSGGAQGGAMPDSSPDVLPDVPPPKGPFPVRTTAALLGGISVLGADIYWVETGPTGGVFRAAKEGSGPITTIYRTNAIDLSAFDVAADSNYVYWSNGSGNKVFRKGAVPGSAQQDYYPGAGATRYLAVGDQGHVYVTEPASVAYGPPSMLFFGGQMGASGIAVYGTDVYWGYTGLGGGIRQAAAGGTSFNEILTGESSGVAGVATDGQDIYWITEKGDVRSSPTGPMARVPRFVCSAPAQVDAASWGGADVAVDDTWVYFTEPFQISKCLKQ